MNTQDKRKQLFNLIQSMDIKDVMNVVNNDDRVLMLNWYYAEHIASAWNTTKEVIEPQMHEIKYMFEKAQCDGCFYDLVDQAEYLEEWSIRIAEES